MTCFGVELDETRNDSKRFFRGHVPSTFEDTRIAIHEKRKNFTFSTVYTGSIRSIR